MTLEEIRARAKGYANEYIREQTAVEALLAKEGVTIKAKDVLRAAIEEAYVAGFDAATVPA